MLHTEWCFTNLVIGYFCTIHASTYYYTHNSFLSEETGQCKQHSCKTEAQSISTVENTGFRLSLWKKDMRADMRWVDLWTDTWPSAGRIIYSCWKMVGEYFIDSLSRVISHTSDRLPDTPLYIFYIAFDLWDSNMLHAELF